MLKNNRIHDYLSDRTLEKILESFIRSTGINLIIRDTKGEQISTLSNNSRLWLEIMKNGPIREQAFNSLKENMDSSIRSGHIQIFSRYMDTLTFIVPIYIEGRITAFFISGLSRLGNPKIEDCIKEAQKLNLELDDFLEMYLELPLVTKEKFEASANLLKVISTTVTTLTREESQIKSKISQITSINDFLKQEVKNSSRELKLSETRYYNLFNNINDGAYIADINGILLDINLAGARMMGYEPHELIGRNFKEVYVNPKDREEQVTKVVLKNGYLQNYHPFVQLKNGGKKYFETNAIAIRNEQGEIVGIQGIFRDISHRPHVPESEPAKTTTRAHRIIKQRTTSDVTKSSIIKPDQHNQKAPQPAK